LVGCVVLFTGDTVTVVGLTLVWGASGALAGIFGLVQARTGLRTNCIPWWYAHRDLGPRFLAEFGASGALTQLTVYVVGVFAGVTAVGALDAAELMLGPFLVLLMGGVAFGVAESARMLKRSPMALYRTSTTFSVALGLASATWGLLVWMLPNRAGAALLGASWPAGRAVLVPTIFYMVASGLSIGPNTGLRALAAARLSLNTKLTIGIASVLAGAVGAVVGGVRGAAWAIAIANILGLWLRWWVYRRALFQRQATQAPPAAVAGAESV